MIWTDWDLLVCIVPSCSGLLWNVMRGEKNTPQVSFKYLSTLGLVSKVFSVGDSWNEILSSFYSPFLCEWSPKLQATALQAYAYWTRARRTKELLCSAIDPGLYSFYPLFEQFFPIRSLPGGQTVAQRGQVFSSISKTTWSFSKWGVWNKWVQSPE